MKQYFNSYIQRSIVFVFFLVCFGNSVFAANCSDVEKADEYLKYDGALIVYLGCKLVTAEDIFRFHNHRDDLIRTKFINNFYHKKSQPDHVERPQMLAFVEEGFLKNSFSSLLFITAWDEIKFAENNGLNRDELMKTGYYLYLRSGLVDRWNTLNELGDYPNMLDPLIITDG
jgi:hypothetical protein